LTSLAFGVSTFPLAAGDTPFSDDSLKLFAGSDPTCKSSVPKFEAPPTRDDMGDGFTVISKEAVCPF
jgi:hypothetical protein